MPNFSKKIEGDESSLEQEGVTEAPWSGDLKFLVNIAV